uniref:SANT domain-containing protein n=1 Tax=Globodera pallida TaxID=36090 RepID=A0A183CN49_GLOPA
MSMKGVIRKPLRRLNIQTIQNATEIQTLPNQNVASVAANASSSIDEVPTVANGDVPENKKSQENKDKNNREFAASMINAIERHVAETMSGININPDRQDKIINGDINTFGQPIENEKLLNQPKREQNDLKQNGLLTIDNSTAEKDEDNSDDSESVERNAKKSENNKNSNDDDEDESKMLEKRNALRQSPIGGSRKLILLKDDVGETPKRRKTGKKRRGQKKHQKSGTSIQQLVTTEDIFGTGDVNLPKIEQVEPANEQEEAIVDEELPPSQSELPPFDAFPSPPPSNQRRNSQIGTQLAQLPDYGRALNMNSIKNVTTKTTPLKPPPPLTTTTTTTTTTMASVPNEDDDHTEIISGERESTTTMEVPKPTTPSKVPRRRQFEKVVPVPHEQQQQLVPPRRVFPSRHGQTTATPAAAAGPINGGLPDEETDSSPFDAERAQFLEHTWHSKQEPTTSRKRVFVETEEQQTTSTNDEDENTEQTTSTTPIIANSRRQNRVERIESRFEAKSPFEKEIRRKPIIDQYIRVFNNSNDNTITKSISTTSTSSDKSEKKQYNDDDDNNTNNNTNYNNHNTNNSSATAVEYGTRHVTPYDIAHFYRMPSGSSRHRESVLTFCSKRAAIRDSANMVIACAGEDGQVWTPLRCPPGTDCLPAADSTFQICCPVAIGRRR